MIDNTQLASLWSRFWAFLIDGIIVFFPLVITQFALPFAGPLIIWFLYQPVLEASPIKATLGKRVMGIMVVDTNGENLSLGMAALRYIVARGSMCILFIGHFFAFFTARKQALHDLVCDSIVIKGNVEGVKAFDAWMETIKSAFGMAEKKINELAVGGGRKDRIQELERLFDLKSKGAITEEEYQRLKAKLMEE